MKKKSIALVLVATIILTFISSAFAYSADDTNKPIISASETVLELPSALSTYSEDNLRESYWNSEEFQMHYAQDPEGAIANLNHASAFNLGDSLSSAYVTNDEVASVEAELVQQLNSYSCGPASAYMAIDGWGETGSIYGSSTEEKLRELASEMGTDRSGTYVYRVTNGLNLYTTDYDYSYYLGQTMTEQEFRIYTFNSLSYGRAPLLHARTALLSYYNGHNSGHYITVTEFDYGTEQVRLHDPNYNDAYYGIHYVPYTEAYDSINVESNRYYICYWP